MRVETIGKLLVYSDAFDVVSEFYNEKAHHKAASENFKSGAQELRPHKKYQC